MTARTGHRQSSSSSSSELHCKSCNAQSLCPLVHFISLSLSDLFWLPAHAPCLLYYNSPQSCTVRAVTLRVRHFPPKPLEELHRCSSSVCDHFVRDSARVPLLLTVTVQHRLLPRANVSRMYAECFDKVLCHVNSRILKCKMTNVITRGSSFHPSSLEKVVTFLVNYKGNNCSIGKQPRENNKVKVKVGTYL